jgi:hypothetical protein
MYECYKPGTVEEVREFVDFVLSARSIMPNEPEDPELDPACGDAEPPTTPRRSDFDPRSDLGLGLCPSKLKAFWDTETEKRKGNSQTELW